MISPLYKVKLVFLSHLNSKNMTASLLLFRSKYECFAPHIIIICSSECLFKSSKLITFQGSEPSSQVGKVCCSDTSKTFVRSKNIRSSESTFGMKILPPIKLLVFWNSSDGVCLPEIAWIKIGPFVIRQIWGRLSQAVRQIVP